MDIVLDVIDSMSSTPLQGATISVNGDAIGQTNTNGVFYLTDIAEFDEITVTFVGYSPYKIAAGILEGSGQIQMARATDQLPTVTVTPSPKKESAVPWLIGFGLLLAMDDKKGSVSGTRKPNTGLIIGIGALALGGIYLLTRPTVSTPTAGLTTQQLLALRAQQANTNPAYNPGGASSWLSLGTSLVSSISSLFGSSSPDNPNTPGYYGSDPIGPAPAPPSDSYYTV